MAKHLASAPEKTKKKSVSKLKVLPRLIEWKKPSRRSFHYVREFSTAEMAPILAAVILFLAACLAPVNGLLKTVAFAISAFAAGFSVLRRSFLCLLKRRWPDEDFLLLLASLLAFLAGRPAVGAILVILGRIAELAEAYVLTRSARGVETLRELLPEKAHVEEEFGLIDIVPEEVKEGDVFLVYKGESFPVDGVILDGIGEVSLSAFGGKETPRTVGVGEEILSGGVNLGETLRLRALRAFEDSALARHLQSLANAENEKTWIEDRIEFYASIFTVCMLVLALIVGLVAPLFHGNWQDALTKAAIIFLLASPSALIVSVPVTFLGGMTCASRSGIRLRAKNYLELLSQAGTIVFGKTGTITDGEFSIAEVVVNKGSEEELLQFAAAAESLSRHPIAEVIKQAAGWTQGQSENVLGIEDVPGRGVTAFIDGKHVYVGNAKLLEEHGIWFQVPNRSGAAIHVAVENNYLGYILLNDKIRDGAYDAIEELRGLGLRNIVMLTGDVRSTTSKLARSLNFDMVKTELTPEEKISAVEYLRRSLGQREALVYVGDGFHDAEMFEKADVGIALNAMGDDKAEQAADVILMDDDILRVPTAFEIADAVDRIVKQNILFLGGVKLLLLILVLCGLLPILPAAVLNMLSVCLTSLNALRSFTIE